MNHDEFREYLSAGMAEADQGAAILRDNPEVVEHLEAFATALFGVLITFRKAGLSRDQTLGFVGGAFATGCDQMMRVYDALEGEFE